MRVALLSIIVFLTLPMSVFAQEAHEKEAAIDAMAYGSLISFVNTLTFGITIEAIRENSVDFADGQMLYRGVAVASLSEAEKKGLNVGRFLGRGAAIITWTCIGALILFLRRKKGDVFVITADASH